MTSDEEKPGASAGTGPRDLPADAPGHELLDRAAVLYQSQKKEALGRLTGGAAHEFNNLLSVIVGNLELLREEPDAPDGDALIGHAIAAAFRGAALTQQMLAYAGRAQQSPVRLNAGERITRMLPEIRRLLPENIDLRTALPERVADIEVDRALLEDAVTNLALNARDAMAPGGMLTLAVHEEDIPALASTFTAGGLSSGRYVVISVADTGCGMGPEVQAHAFDPFFTTKSVGRGSGMGLSTALGFCQQSGGTARISSQIEAGTTVEMVFPAALHDQDRAPAQVTNGDGLNILLVEDEPDVLRMLERQLKSVGHRVSTATSGDQALDRIKGGLAPDLVLSDVVMPGALQGPELAHRIHEILPHVALIFISGHPKETPPGAELEQFADAIILSKPVPKAQLLDAVASVAARAGGQA